MKKLIIVDLDNGLTESKTQISFDMAELLEELLKKYSVAIISGAAYKQYKFQLLDNLPLLDELLKKLYLFPTWATAFYKYEDRIYKKIYAENLTDEQKKKIFAAFNKCFDEIGFVLPRHCEYGEILEDRDTQITFSALGQNAPLHLKKRWDSNFIKRISMMDILRRELTDVSIRAGGTTSIDITRNVDQTYCIKQIKNHLGLEIDDCIYIGNQIGLMKETGMECIETSGPAETIKIIGKLI
jgi:HAD superfamily hydrolase (TIGR01484 family)